MLPLLSLTVILVCPKDPFWARSCFPCTSRQSLTLSYSTVCHICCLSSVYSWVLLASLHSWFCHSGLALNPSKSEAIIFGTRQRLNSFPRPSVIHILSSSVHISDYITTFGVTLDSNLTLNKHISSVCKSAYYSIKAIRHIRPVLTCDMARAVAASLTQTRLDFANLSELLVATSINVNASKTALLEWYFKIVTIQLHQNFHSVSE